MYTDGKEVKAVNNFVFLGSRIDKDERYTGEIREEQQ